LSQKGNQAFRKGLIEKENKYGIHPQKENLKAFSRTCSRIKTMKLRRKNSCCGLI